MELFETSESVNQLLTAVAECKKLLGNTIAFDDNNPHFKNDFASLKATLKKIEGPTRDCNLILTQWPAGEMVVIAFSIWNLESGCNQPSTSHWLRKILKLQALLCLMLEGSAIRLFLGWLGIRMMMVKWRWGEEVVMRTTTLHHQNSSLLLLPIIARMAGFKKQTPISLQSLRKT